MSLYDSFFPHQVDVEKADTSQRDASGGVLDSAWSVELAGVRGVLEPAGASQQAVFAQAGFTVSHVFVTCQAGILAGRRLHCADDGSYLRVQTVEHVRGLPGAVPDFYRVGAQLVRLA